MQITTQAIVLAALHYGDTSLVVKAYTESSGVRSYMLKGVLGRKKGKLRAAHFQPLMQLEIVANHRDKGSLERMSEAKVAYLYQDLYSNPAKNSMVLFLAEMLANSIQEEEANPALYQYIATALQWLDSHSHIANFHVFFLLGLTKYLGFYPDISTINAPYFDLVEGAFLDRPVSGEYIEGQQLEVLRQFFGIPFDALEHIKLSREQRKKLLKSLVHYYGLHLQGFREPKSLTVLYEIFS